MDGRPPDSKREKLRAGQRIDVVFPQQVMQDVLPENIELSIVYEDADLIVVDKPKGLVVHPGQGNPDGTLVNALLYHTSELSKLNGPVRQGIVHRIDKDTSGLLVVAKNDYAHRSLAKQLFDRTVERRYTGIVWHGFSEEEGIIDAPIGRDPRNRLKRAVVDEGKEAITHYRIIERLGKFTSIEAKLETGRTHQIRVHMSHIQHPLLGDIVYGPRKQPFGLTEQMLHASVLGFMHPSTGEFMRFQSRPPSSYCKVVEMLKNRL